jgi:predicted helicase
MKDLALTDNVALVVSKQCMSDWRYALVTNDINDMNLTATASRLGAGYTFPLYAYSSDIDGTEGLLLNFNKEVLCQIESCLCESIDPQELFDYIYAILYSPTYRSRFSEFLKIDFPRIPYPESKEIYHLLASKGAELRHLNLLDGEENGQSDVAFEGETNEDECMRIMQLNYTDGKVYINSGQCFSNIPQGVWDFFIGGYQPARKWLQERKDNDVVLSFEDIEYYPRVIHALTETERLMREIDDIYKENYYGTKA